MGICQLVLMDADTSHVNVGGVFLRKKMALIFINSRKCRPDLTSTTGFCSGSAFLV